MASSCSSSQITSHALRGNTRTGDAHEIYELIVKDAKTLGYEAGPIIEHEGARLQKQWKYFPYVDSEALNSHYLALEALQGQNTFYSGALLSFETVHNVVAYSRSLVECSFPALGQR